MNCSICHREVVGHIDVREHELTDGTPVISMDSSPDRDWILCDSCNALVCHGYCDTCIEKYHLADYLAQVGSIPRREDQCL